MGGERLGVGLGVALAGLALTTAAFAQVPHEGEPDVTAALVESWISISGQLNERLLNTVYWMLGATITLFVVLVGFSWFANCNVR